MDEVIITIEETTEEVIVTVLEGEALINDSDTSLLTTWSSDKIQDEFDNLVIPENTSDLVNDSNFVSDADYVHTDNNFTDAYQTQSDFNVVTSVAYATEIPFTKALTVIAGKSLTTNDVLTIGANPVEGATAICDLTGDGSHSPVVTAFDYQVGEYDNTLNVINRLVMYYLGAQTTIEFRKLTAV